MRINEPVTNKELVLADEACIVSRTDDKGRIVEVNDDFIRYSGFAREELMGKAHNIVRHPDMPPEAFADLWNTIKRGLPWIGIVKNRCKNGDHYWVEAQVTPIREGNAVTGFQSVRRKPQAEQVKDAEEAYRLFREGRQGRLVIQQGKVCTAGVFGRVGFQSRFGIKARLMSVGLWLISLSLLLGVLGITGMHKANVGMRDVYESRTIPLGNLDGIIRLVLRNRLALAQAIMHPDAVTVRNQEKMMEGNAARISQLWEEFMSGNLDGDLKDVAVQWGADRRRFVEDGLRQSFALLRAGRVDEARQFYLSEGGEGLDAFYVPVREGADKLIKLQLDLAKQEYDAAVERYEFIRNVSIGVTVVGVMLSIIALFTLMRAILQPLAAVRNVLRDFEAGKLNAVVRIDRMDEMGQLLASTRQMQGVLSRVVTETKEVVRAAAAGNFSRRVDTMGMEGFQRELADNVNNLVQTTDAGIRDVSTVLEALADGDLTKRVDNHYEGLFGKLKDDVNRTSEQLSTIVSHIKASSETINTASSEIASANGDLSSRTEQQASSLEETATSMDELSSTVKQNAENARQANQLAIGASDVAVKGGEAVRQVVQTMGGISDSSKKIADIIGVIDGIAFQTNILALNAAVEAARAGEQGRGFAVVATEVRNLAQRSAAAAKEIKGLITDSVSKVDTGSHLVDQAGKTMQEIVTSVKRVTDIMSEISRASVEQSDGIDQVSAAVGQMDESTQQNAAMVEQSAAAAESLRDETTALVGAVLKFKLAEDAGFVSRVQTLGHEFVQIFPGGFARDASARVDHDGKTLPGLKSGARVVSGSNDAVDAFSAKHGVVATIFALQGNEFVRVSTSIRDEAGERALGTNLDQSHPAHGRLLRAESFDGTMVLFSRPYMTHYEPLADANGEIVGAAFVGMDMSKKSGTSTSHNVETLSLRPRVSVTAAMKNVVPQSRVTASGGRPR